MFWGRSVALLRPAGARLGSRMRGKAPHEARTLQQRLDELDAKDPFYSVTYDIGLPHMRPSRSKELYERLAHVQSQKKNPEIERLARTRRLFVDLDDVEKEWLKNNGPFQIKRIAEHYDIFKHLYTEGYFVPRIPMNILYDADDDLSNPVYYGNIIKPTDAKNAPSVSFEAEEGSLWTLTLTNLDGHLTEPGKEYLHWCVANIPAGDVAKGETVAEYMQPIPPKGTGFHRYVFVLYKQTEKVAYDLKKATVESPLEDRTFVTRDWYSKYQDIVTPGGLAFFQSDWDINLTDFYHNILNMKEPVYEYDFPKPYIRPQEWFPRKKPFNVYLDKYRDPKDVNREYLLRKLKAERPFKNPDPPLKYPNAHPFAIGVPSWLRLKERHIRMGWGRISRV